MSRLFHLNRHPSLNTSGTSPNSLSSAANAINLIHMPAITETEGQLAKRVLYTCSNGYYYSNGSCYYGSSWYWWGRWVFAGIFVVFILFMLVCLGCIHARRRRKRGTAPLYGTGWMAPGSGKYGNNTYQPNATPYQPPPPQYTANTQQNPQYTGQTFNPADGYYGGHTEGVQAPQNSYYPPARGGENVYQPPPGPPPGK